MVLRMTSRKFEEAPQPCDESLLQEEPEVHHDEPLTQGGDFVSRELSSNKKVVAADLALDWVLQEIVQQARLATTATGAFIGLARGRNLVCQASSGSNAGEFVAYLNRDRRMVDSCFASSTAQRCRDSETFPELDVNTCRYLGARSVVMVPIIAATGEKLIFGVFSPQVEAFSNANLMALETLSRRIGDAMTQITRCTSLSSGGALPRSKSDSAKASLSYKLGSAQRSLLGLGGPAVWGFAILIVLLGGWMLSRAVNRWTVHTPAQAPAFAISQSASTQPLADRASPVNAGSPPQTPAMLAPVKSITATAENRTPVADVHAAKSGKKIAARSAPHVPNLEIENELDDASSVSRAAETVNPSRASVPSAAEALPSTSVARTTISTNASSSPGLNGTFGTPAGQAVHLTRDPEAPHTPVAPPSNVASSNPITPNAGSGPAAPVVVGEQIALDHLTERVEPEYPQDAKAQHAEGTVTLDVVVNRNGEVERVTPVSGDPRFQPAAAKAVAKWRFLPLTNNNRIVRFETHITVRFALP